MKQIFIIKYSANGNEVHPKASAVKAQAISEDDPASAKLSEFQDLIWCAPTNFDTMPTTAANIAKVRKIPVAPFPPMPAETFPSC